MSSELTSESDDQETDNCDESLCFSELEAAETASTVSSVASHLHEIPNFSSEIRVPANISPPHLLRQLIRREMGTGKLPLIPPLKTYILSDLFPNHVLSTHVFMGMTRCGRFLITYTVQTLVQMDPFDEWYSYKYVLHWWLFKPNRRATKLCEIQLFGSENISAILEISICQWPTLYDNVIVYGLLKDGASNNQRAFVTVTALPSANYCTDCSSYLPCNEWRCLRHCYTVHTSFDITVPYPEFKPEINLKCPEYVVFNTNNTLHALRVSLGDLEAEREPLQPLEMPSNASRLQEQIIKDFESEEATLTPKNFGEDCLSPPLPTRWKVSQLSCLSPPMTRVNLDCSKKEDVFLSPKHILKSKRCDRKRLGTFFTRRKGPLEVYMGQSSSSSSSVLRKSSPYEFVDDAQHEVEKLSQFRRKRLAEKTYEFQEGDSENIFLPFSQARLLSPIQPENEPHVLRPLNRNTRSRFSRPVFGDRSQTSKPSSCYHRLFKTRPEILVHDLSGRYGHLSALEETRFYANLLKMTHRFQGAATRVNRCFSDIDQGRNLDDPDDEASNIAGYHTVLNLEVYGPRNCRLHALPRGKRLERGLNAISVEQQTLDIEAVCQSVATSLCNLVDKTFVFCNDYDVEIIDVCPRSGDVLVLLLMRIEAAGVEESCKEKDHEQLEASVSFVWNLHEADYRVKTVVPPQKVAWVLHNSSYVWNPAKEAARAFLRGLPVQVTWCEPRVRVCANMAALRGISLPAIYDRDNYIQFVL